MKKFLDSTNITALQRPCSMCTEAASAQSPCARKRLLHILSRYVLQQLHAYSSIHSGGFSYFYAFIVYEAVASVQPYCRKNAAIDKDLETF